MGKIDSDKLFNLKLLLSAEGIGPARILQLISKFHSFEDIFNASKADLQSVEGISGQLASRILSQSKNRDEYFLKWEKELKKLERLKIQVLTFWDEGFPTLLRNIYAPPLILYIAGELNDADSYSIAVVGTRTPTVYGKIQAEKFSAELAKNSVTVVSGMARGIDSIAHRSALKNSGRTIAVVGSGLDIIYPPENRNLFKKISERGAVISEFPLGTKPDAQNFPQRNRIISGLSLGTLVIESKINGGAMQTAAYSLDQNREVFAAPGNLGVPQSEGTNLRIQKGEAKLVNSVDDIFNELSYELRGLRKDDAVKPEIALTLFEEKIFGVLGNKQKHIDLIAAEASMSTADCLVHLLSLEFKGVVKQLPGKVFTAM